ncbi:MAG: hypothetical protein DMG76_23690 [Acidobacteria bacterium]|nr:MAG: hypothetical protein DMG76_23690 [Acidobacteriota bacterium]
MTQSDQDGPKLHRGKQFVGFWVSPLEHALIREASWRLGKSRNTFLIDAITDEMQSHGLGEMAEQMQEAKIERLRAKSTHKMGFAGRKKRAKSLEANSDGSITL